MQFRTTSALEDMAHEEKRGLLANLPCAMWLDLWSMLMLSAGSTICLTAIISNGLALDSEPLAVLLRLDTGELYAGIHGFTWGGYCEIKTLFVAEAQRSKGIGGYLLRAAQDEAVRRGCAQMLLSTHGFQAPLFYERHGFRRAASIANCPRGDSYILMIKSLFKG